MDALFVNPGGQADLYQVSQIATNYPGKEPPIWAGMLANYARLKGFDVGILDSNALNLSYQQTVEQIIAAKAKLAALVIYGHQPNASTQTMAPAGEIARLLKQIAPEQKVLFVGGHVAALAERTLREEVTDFICTGEGPVTVVELLQALNTVNGGLNLNKVRGLGYWNEGRVCLDYSAPNVTNLDEEMPGMAEGLLDKSLGWAHDWHCYGRLDLRRFYWALYTSLGCRWGCGFCPIQAPFKPGEAVLGLKPEINSYRMWSPDLVIQWIDKLVEQGIMNIKFADEMFVLNPSHVLGICDRIIERGYGDQLNIWAYSRIDSCQERFLDKLRRAGFRWLAFGIESANAKIRAQNDKGSFREETIFDVIGRVQNAGIDVIGNYMFGLRGDTFETMTETLKLAMALKTKAANFNPTMCFPGTKDYALALKEGWQLPERWSQYSYHSRESFPMHTETLPNSVVLAFRDLAFQYYHTDPAHLRLLEQTFGPETATYVRETKATVRYERDQVDATTAERVRSFMTERFGPLAVTP